MKTFKKIGVTLFITLFLSVTICYGQNIVKENDTKGVELAKLGKFKEAKEEFEKVLKVDPNHGSVKRALSIIEDALDHKIERRTAVHLFNGIDCNIKKLWDESIEEFDKAVEFNPKYFHIYILRGNTYYDKNQFDEAISDYSKAIEINPKYAKAYNNRGNALYDKGQYEKALSDYSKAIEINPKYADAYDGLEIALNAHKSQRHRSVELFLFFWQICFAIAFFSGVLKGRKVFGFIFGIAGPLGAIVVLCTPSAIKRCIACKNKIPKKAIKCPLCQTDQPKKLIIKKELPVKKRIIKWLILFVPIFLWLLTVGSCVYKHHRIDQLMKDAEGLVWGNNSAQLIVHVQKKRIGEKDHYRIQVVKPDGEIAHESEMVIDNDMWGGGFVKAVNADDDAKLEVVAWGAHEVKESFYLDYVKGIVQQKPFSHATTETKYLAREWHNAQDAELVPFFLFLLLIVYYMGVGIASLVIWLWRRRKRKTHI